MPTPAPWAMTTHLWAVEMHPTIKRRLPMEILSTRNFQCTTTKAIASIMLATE